MINNYYFLVLTLIILSSIFISPKDSKSNLYWNQAASFAGNNNSYLSVKDDADLDITGSFTLEAWVNPSNVLSPSFQIIFQKRQTTATGYTLYLNNGRVTIRTNSSTRLIGKTVIPNNQWTHIAGTYNSTSNIFRIIINGITDSSVTIAGAAPTAGADSLLIGKGSNDPFAGEMDEIRIWKRDLSTFEIGQQYRTSLAVNSGKYSDLVYSLTFQDDDNSGDPFTLADCSFKNGNAKNNNVTPVSLSDRPSNTVHPNDCLELDGSNDYLAAPDISSLSPTSGITLSAWINPRSVSNCILIHKGPAGGGAGTNYRLALLNGNIFGAINGDFNFISAGSQVPENQWSHVAFTYDGSGSGEYRMFLNGKTIKEGINDLGSINDGTDSLYIGGTTALLDLDGYIDEVVISQTFSSSQDISDLMFRSRNLVNTNDVAYNFDGYATSNSGIYTAFGHLMYFRNQASFAYNGGVGNAPQSPLIGSDNTIFQDGFLLKASDRRIPETGSSGFMLDDTLEILQTGTVSNIQFFIGLNHTYERDLKITLINPAGNSVVIFDNITYLGNSENLVTIFNDLADSSLITDRYTSLSPQIKPLNSMVAGFGLSGINGSWILRIEDQIGGDTGRVYGWGMRFNNNTQKQHKLDVAAYMQGFYNPGTNSTIRDTMRFNFKNSVFPHALIDNEKAFMSQFGLASINFSNVSAGVPYYLTVRHRNLVETWSNGTVMFDPLTYQLEYDFRSNLNSAYGNNMIFIDNSPVTFGCYNGDVNQDKQVDISDLSLIDNDAFNFAGGYIPTDVNGDAFIDLTDYALADNNAFNFVGAIVPPAPPPPSEPNSTVDVISSDPAIGNASVVRIRTEGNEADAKEESNIFNENYRVGEKISQEEIDRADGKK